MNAQKEKKPRTPPRRGIRSAAQSFCKVCGWESGHYYGKGAWANAAGELAQHRDKAKCV